jgi:hypothetical protein
MQSPTRLISAFTLSTTMFLGTVAMAADLPKEGTFSVTYSSAGTFKPTPIGKGWVAGAYDENGLTVGTGLFDHMTWHCWGLADIANSMTEWHGYCVGTDPAGDQIAADIASDGKYPSDAKSYKGTGKLTRGTGKYAGITGDWTVVCHALEFRTAVDGTYVQYATTQGSYKLP